LKIKKLFLNSGIQFAEIKYFSTVYENYMYHSHSNPCVCIIEEGTIKIQYSKDEEYIKKEKDIFMFNPKQIHKIENVDAKGYYIVFFSNIWCNNIKPEANYQIDYKVSIDREISIDFLNFCKKILFEQYKLREEIFFKSFIGKLFENYGKKVKTVEENKTVTLAKEYIFSNLDDKLTTNDIALHLGYDKSYFIRFFKDNMGITPNNYIINKKIERIKDKLTNSLEDINLAVLAQEQGFCDQSHLNKNFKKIYAVSPNKYM
jgi:AraC-like DNA-binding protein